jgi:hypothetical protein
MYTYKNPRRKTSMLFDATMLQIRAMRNAAGDEDHEDEAPEAKAPDDIVEGDGDSGNDGLEDGQGDGDVDRANLAANTSPGAAPAPQATAVPARLWKAEREQVRDALNAITSYRGIRGTVEIDQKRQPKQVKGMVLQALPQVNSQWMRWWPYKFGPPW